MGSHNVSVRRVMRISAPLLLPLVVLVPCLLAAPVPAPTFTETITLTTGVLPIILAKLLFLKGAVLGNVLAEAPERLTALSRQQLKEEPDKGNTDLRTANTKTRTRPLQSYKRPKYKKPSYRP